MLKLPSLIKEYSAIYSGDPSLVQFPEAPPEGASEEALEQYEVAVKEYAHKLKVARETGDCGALRIEGAGEPTLFQLKPLTADQYTYVIGKFGDDTIECNVLAFRCALRSVANLPGAEVKLVQHEKLGMIADLSFFDKVGLPAGLSVRIAVELGALAISRANPSPS